MLNIDAYVCCAGKYLILHSEPHSPNLKGIDELGSRLYTRHKTIKNHS